ncbi:hypothetical protein PG997_001132 [Apiospora hydei]|uniref:Uncharacterized protein n=1 Tax=Apiospora hydei TaxID=1337664 RepID=A0ABR1XCU8_9PEZI
MRRSLAPNTTPIVLRAQYVSAACQRSREGDDDGAFQDLCAADVVGATDLFRPPASPNHWDIKVSTTTSEASLASNDGAKVVLCPASLPHLRRPTVERLSAGAQIHGMQSFVNRPRPGEEELSLKRDSRLNPSGSSIGNDGECRERDSLAPSPETTRLSAHVDDGSRRPILMQHGLMGKLAEGHLHLHRHDFVALYPQLIAGRLGMSTKFIVGFTWGSRPNEKLK